MSRRTKLIQALWIYSAVTVLVFVTLAPLVWLFIMSVSSTRDLTNLPIHWISDQWDFSRYVRLLGNATLDEKSVSEEFLAASWATAASGGDKTLVKKKKLKKHARMLNVPIRQKALFSQP